MREQLGVRRSMLDVRVLMDDEAWFITRTSFFPKL